MSIGFIKSVIIVKRGNNIGRAIKERLKSNHIAPDTITIDSIVRNTTNRTNIVTLTTKL